MTAGSLASVLLAIDTSAGTSVAVVDGDRVLSRADEPDTRRHAEWQRERRSIHMADGQAEHDGARKLAQNRGERRPSRGLAARVVAARERPEHDRGRTGEDTRQLQLREETVQPVRPLGDILGNLFGNKP